MKIGALLAKLLPKAGLDIKDAKYADVLAISTEIDDADANTIQGGLFSMEDAKTNIPLKTHFTKALFDGADEEMNRIMDEEGLGISDKEELNAVKSSFQRIGKLTKKIADLEKKKAGASAGDKKELQDKINEATNKIVELNNAHKEEIKNINLQWQNKLTNTTVKSLLAGKKYANANIPADVNIETALVILNKELQKDGAKVVNTENGLQLKQIKDESLDWSSSTNEKPSFEQYLDGKLAANKILAVNDQDGNEADTGNNGKPPAATSIPGGNSRNPMDKGNYNELINQQLAAEKAKMQPARN